MIDKLIIATRGSRLALKQSEIIKAQLESTFPSLTVELSIFKTVGDKILDKPLSKIGGKGLFVKELEEAMIRGDAHLAVHSLKDVPVELPEELQLSAITEREDVRDAFLSENFSSIDELPNDAVIGTTSLRRGMQILVLRPDLQIKTLRGNVNTRIRKLKDGEYDAIILATAGINRLSLQNEVKFFKPISTDLMIPAMGQGALGIESVKNKEVLELISTLHDEKSNIETRIERDFVEVLEGGCQVPIGINTVLVGNKVKVKAIVGMPDGSEILREETEDSKENYQTIGKRLAEKMLQKGARELLQRAEKFCS